MMNLLILLALLNSAPKVDYSLKEYVDVGIGTVFSSDDEFNPDNRAACTHKKLDDKGMYIAHRTLPCKSKVVVCNSRNNKCVLTTVIDRGPYGLTFNGKRVVHTSVVDMTEAVAKRIGHNGFERVFIISPRKIDKKTIKLKGMKVRRAC
jgi:rare lipoprotein A (peptidoglycan hydrolase)